jgi:hypothetical protein
MNVYICSVLIDIVELSFYLISRAAPEMKSWVRDYSRVCIRKLDKIQMQTFNFLPVYGSPL